ncbi:MAG: hypothetical protein HRU46_06540 [Verrucomicrobiales bacterium]|nr:hypothetical protein [Verrucomicrobiales bacterium]
MKKLFIAAVAALSMIGIAEAGCGKKQTDAGTLSSYDKDTKTLVVSVDGKDVTLTATKKTEAKDADGKATDLDSLVGKEVKVTSEHKKVDSVEAS